MATAAAAAPAPTLTLRSAFAAGAHRGSATARLGRAHNARVPALLFAAGCAGSSASTLEVAGGAIAIVGTYIAAAAANDLADVEADRRNRRDDLPLVAGTGTAADAGAACVVGAGLALGAQLALPQPAGLLVVLLAAAIGWSYSCAPLALERRGWAGPLLLAAGYLALPLWFGAAVRGGNVETLAALGLVLLGAGVLAHKDVRDLVGDAATGKRTPAVRSGVAAMARQAAALGAAGLIALGLASPSAHRPALAGAVICLVALAAMAVTGHDRRWWAAARLALVAAALLVAV